jgi:biotin carboxylase
MGFETVEEALENAGRFKFPVMVKPVDSSGSKGVNKIACPEELQEAFADAMKYSRCKKVIVEEFIHKKGYQISGDAFSVDGKLVFHCFGNEYYSKKVTKDFAPLGECWPFMMEPSIIGRLHDDLQRLITSLGMRSTAYNVEAIVDRNDNIYILELGARSGGSLIPQITEYATGVNLVTYVIKAAMGEDCADLVMKPSKGCWSNFMVHAKTSGKYIGIWFDENFRKNNLVEFVTDIEEGDEVHEFRDAQDAIGTLIVKYDSVEQMFHMIEHMDDYVKVIVNG